MIVVLTVTAKSATQDTVCTKYAIRAGKILTMAPQPNPQKTPPVINHGIILVSNGKIEALGTKDEITIPKGYAIIEASDRWVMPGIVEAHSHIGADMRDLNDMVTQVNPELQVSDCVWPDDFALKKAIPEVLPQSIQCPAVEPTKPASLSLSKLISLIPKI